MDILSMNEVWACKTDPGAEGKYHACTPLYVQNNVWQELVFALSRGMNFTQ